MRPADAFLYIPCLSEAILCHHVALYSWFVRGERGTTERAFFLCERPMLCRASLTSEMLLRKNDKNESGFERVAKHGKKW